MTEQLDHAGSVLGGLVLVTVGTLVLVHAVPSTPSLDVPVFGGVSLVLLGVILLLLSHDHGE